MFYAEMGKWVNLDSKINTFHFSLYCALLCTVLLKIKQGPRTGTRLHLLLLQQDSNSKRCPQRQIQYVLMHAGTRKQVLNGIDFKVRPSRSKKVGLMCFNESHLKLMKNNCYFILKALFVLKMFKFLSWLFWECRKMASQGN